MFTKFPEYDRYRALRLRKPPLAGEDVYALQTGLWGLGFDPGPSDGIYGEHTDVAVRDAQFVLKLTKDGIVGPQVWTTLSNRIAQAARDKHKIATGLMYGQLAHESSLRGGMYSPQRPDGSYDAGVAQRNTRFTPPDQGFNMPASILKLAENTRAYYNKFQGVQGKRRWGLAAGAWNAPAYASYIANEEGATVPRSTTAKPSADARQKLEAYIASATAYLR